VGIGVEAAVGEEGGVSGLKGGFGEGGGGGHWGVD
jgi:hypothetical protein